MTYVYRIGRSAARASVAKYAHRLKGRCLDVGPQGRKSRYFDLLNNIDSYTSLDIDPKSNPDIVSDAEYMTQVDDESFDSILCTQVLYAVKHPQKVIAEFNRVLKKDGLVLMTVPFLTLWIGEHDHWRFSPSGIRLLLEENGFTVIVAENTGVGVFSVMHQIFTKWLKIVLDLPRRNFWRKVFNKVFIVSAKVATQLDRIFSSRVNNQFFLDVTVLARKA